MACPNLGELVYNTNYGAARPIRGLENKHRLPDVKYEGRKRTVWQTQAR